MKGDLAMARNTEKTGWLNYQLKLRVKWVLAAIIALPLALGFVLVATDPDENVALSRNEVVENAAGERIWYGQMRGSDTTPYREVAVTIRFLDQNGMPVGAVTAQDELLEPGEGLELQALLPPEAINMQVYSLQWRLGRASELLAPWPAWEFGYLQRKTS
jgi:hypothetical protein